MSVDKTVIHGTLKMTNVQKGIFGSQKSAQNPVTVNLRGEENIKKGIIEFQYTLIKFITNQIVRAYPEEFKELKPDVDTFKVTGSNADNRHKPATDP